MQRGDPIGDDEEATKPQEPVETAETPKLAEKPPEPPKVTAVTTATVASGDEPDRATPYIGTYLYNDPDDEDDARYALAHQRGPGLWLPLVIFVALLVGGALIGRYLLPGKPVVDAAPPSQTSISSNGESALVPPLTPSLPALPTPPARPADALREWASRVSAVVNVPPVAIEAYGYTQLVMQQDDSSCHLGWNTLAGIGEVESRHGQAGGAQLQASGRSTPLVVGPLLNGKSGQPLVQDTDAGAYDGDATYDRAMGPLLLLPSMWTMYASDADGDGIFDPYDIDDASLAVGRMLCAGTEDLNQLAGWTAAVGRLHAGQAYAKSVFEAADSYGQRSRSVG